MGEWFLIWNGKSEVWWRANSCGYTQDLTQAGLYTRDECDRKIRANHVGTQWDEKERAVPLAEKVGELLAMRADLLAVAQALDEYQKVYEMRTYDSMPGNTFYAEKAMQIVHMARAAIARTGAMEGPR